MNTPQPEPEVHNLKTGFSFLHALDEHWKHKGADSAPEDLWNPEVQQEVQQVIQQQMDAMGPALAAAGIEIGQVSIDPVTVYATVRGLTEQQRKAIDSLVKKQGLVREDPDGLRTH